MCHVEESTGSVPLHTHISGFGKPRQRAQGTRPCNLGLVFFMCSQVGDASYGIALDLNIWR